MFTLISPHLRIQYTDTNWLYSKPFSLRRCLLSVQQYIILSLCLPTLPVISLFFYPKRLRLCFCYPALCAAWLWGLCRSAGLLAGAPGSWWESTVGQHTWISEWARRWPGGLLLNHTLCVCPCAGVRAPVRTVCTCVRVRALCLWVRLSLQLTCVFHLTQTYKHAHAHAHTTLML